MIDGASSALFDHWQHDTRGAILRQRIKDGRVRECLARWRQAGLLDGQERVVPEQGRPQGAVLSPLVANVYVHEVRDTGCETGVRAPGRGTGGLDRDADDGVRGCAWAEDARRSTEGLPKRCAKDGRESNPAKTPVVAVGRPQRPASGHTAGTCSLLGCVHDWGKTGRGSDPITRQTEGKRLRRTLGACWRWCRDNRPRPLQAQYASLCVTLRGYSQYYGIRWNSQCLDLVDHPATRAWR